MALKAQESSFVHLRTPHQCPSSPVNERVFEHRTRLQDVIQWRPVSAPQPRDFVSAPGSSRIELRKSPLSCPETPGSKLGSWQNVKVKLQSLTKSLQILSRVLQTALGAHGSVLVGKYHHIVTISDHNCLSSCDRYLKEISRTFWTLGLLAATLISPDKLFPRCN